LCLQALGTNLVVVVVAAAEMLVEERIYWQLESLLHRRELQKSHKKSRIFENKDIAKT